MMLNRRVFQAAAVAVIAGLAACGNGASGDDARTDFEREGDFATGSPDAPVVMVEYASTACPACANFNINVKPTINQYIENGTLRLVFREMITAPRDLAIAGFMLARCAPEDRYFDVLDLVFEQQQAIYQSMQDGRGLQQFQTIAGSAGIDQQRFRECMSDEAMMAEVTAASEQAARDGVNATPTFYFNGELVSAERAPDGSGLVWAADGDPIEDEDGFIPAQFSGDSFERIILHYQARAEGGSEG
jgi:protein-disulfide isomerase